MQTSQEDGPWSVTKGSPREQAEETGRRKKKGFRHRFGQVLFIVFALFIGLVILGAIVGKQPSTSNSTTLSSSVDTPSSNSGTTADASNTTAPAPVTPAPASCESDFSACSDNADLVNHFDGFSMAQVQCKDSAEDAAKCGTPKFPWFAFSSFRNGDNGPKTGVMDIIEPNAQYSNGYGAMVHSTVTCTYNFGAKDVTNISIEAND